MVFDAYQDDFAAQQREKDKEKKDKPLLTGMKREAKKVETKVCDINSRLLLAAKTIERMINQNTFDDIAQGDYSFACMATNYSNYFLTHSSPMSKTVEYAVEYSVCIKTNSS